VATLEKEKRDETATAKKMRNFCAYFLDGNPGTGTLYVQTVKMADIIITVNGHYTGQPALAGTSS